MSETLYDIAIIGGGVNGCGIARDAAGRGLSVLLAEQHDLASATSSASTKLIHGGLRYLERFEFRLVRESLLEREVMLAMAPHIVRPLRFILPHHNALRPAWLIRLGMFIYDHLGARKLLPRSRSVNLRRGAVGEPLKPTFTRGFEYWDCRVDDARLVVLNAMDAARHGADIRVRTKVTSAARENGHWRVGLADLRTGRRETISASVLINAAGPWISEVISERIGLNSRYRTRLVKGSHIVVPRIFTHDRAYIFQNADRRIIFAIPYEHDFTLIGTTDVDYEDDPALVSISADEMAYLCEAASEYFSAPIRTSDVVWSYAGLRPLYEEIDEEETSAQETTRDYELDLLGEPHQPPLLNIFGGKITTYRCLAEEALQMLKGWLPDLGDEWTRNSSLPGGDFAVNAFDSMAEGLQANFPMVDMPLARRLAHSYGTLAREILAGAETTEELGIHFGAGLYQREVEYLVNHEWAASAEDVLWRRTKLGLRLTEAEVERLDQWLKENFPEATPPPA